jgi:hypothetical protein
MIGRATNKNKGILRASLHNNVLKQQNKIDTIVSTFVFICVSGNATCFEPFLGHLQAYMNISISL